MKILGMTGEVEGDSPAIGPQCLQHALSVGLQKLRKAEDFTPSVEGCQGMVPCGAEGNNRSSPRPLTQLGVRPLQALEPLLHAGAQRSEAATVEGGNNRRVPDIRQKPQGGTEYFRKKVSAEAPRKENDPLSPLRSMEGGTPSPGRGEGGEEPVERKDPRKVQPGAAENDESRPF